jgi:UDP-2,4-diacetamido-2,4,6-trideoxy-beta-L-altropyranose hydrolase
MNPLTVAIRANGNDVVGLGHIRRCLSLGQALSRQGATVRFISNSDKAALALIARNGFEATPVDLENDLAQTCAALDQSSANGLVIDSYDIDTTYLVDVRKHVSLLAVIDDIADRRLPVDVVINGAIYASELCYDVPPNTILLLAAQYAILRREFALEPERVIAGPASRILVTLGGSDSTGLTLRLIEWLLQESQGIILDVVVGPFFNDRKTILEMAAQRPEQVRAHYNPEDMRSLMLDADLAISGGGQTTYELAATGTPTVAIATAENQLQNLAALAQAGSLLHAGSADDRDLQTRLLRQIRKIINDRDKRSEMSRTGRRLVDGRGAERAARHMIAQMRREGALTDGNMLQIRPSDSGDVQLLWEWANDPNIRRNSHHSEPIPWESHRGWYNARLLSPDTRFWILEKSGEPVGQIRYDKDRDRNSAELSFSIAGKHRGQGYGTELVRRTRELACAELSVGRITAVTFMENTASARVFKRLGFTLLGSALIKGHQCYQFYWGPAGNDD